MSEDLSLKFGIDAAPAVEGVEKVEGAVTELSGTLKTQLGPAGEAAYAAFQKLANAEGPRALQRALVDATVATDNFKKSVEAAAASGQKMPAGVGAALKTMQADLDAGSAKLGTLKNAMNDVAVRANQAGQSFKYLEGAGGGLQGMLNALEGSSSNTVATLGKLGLAGIGVAGIFGTVVIAAKSLSEGLNAAIDKHQKLIDTEEKGKSAAETHAAAMRALDSGLIANSDSVAGLIQNYNLLILAQGRGSAAARQAAADFAGVGEALKNYATETQKAETLSALLEGAFKRSGAEGMEMARLMESSIRSIEAEYRALGDAVPAGLRKAIDALDSLAGKNKAALAAAQEFAKGLSHVTVQMYDLTEANEKYSGSLDRIKDRLREAEDLQKNMTAAIEADTAAFDAHTAAIDRAAAAVTTATDSMERLGSGMKAVAGGTATMTTSLTLATGTFFTVTAATDAQNKALEDLLKTQGAYNDSLAKTLDTAKGWKDYLAQLTDAYQSGAMDLLQYKNALVAFQTQLVQTFSGATGAARKGIEDMQAAIQKLIDTAGGGPLSPTGPWQGPSGAINKAFGG